MTTIGLTQVPASCWPNFLAKVVTDTDSIDLTNAAGTLSADLIVSPAPENLVAVSASGVYVAPPDVALQLAAGAFADPANPTLAEVETAVAGAVEEGGMIAYFLGNGTADAPDWAWYISEGGAAMLIQEPPAAAIQSIEILPTSVTNPDWPDANEVSTWAMTNGIVNAYIYMIGNGTADNPDYVWYVDYYSTLINVESPTQLTLAGPFSAPQAATNLKCLSLNLFDVSGGTVTQPLPPASSVPAGCKVGVKVLGLSGADELVVTPSGADTIDGDSSYALKTNNMTAFFASNGVGSWYIAYDYDPLQISGVICGMDGQDSGPNLSLQGTSSFLIDGQTAALYEWTIRETNSSGTILQQFSGAPADPAAVTGYVIGGTYENPELQVGDYCGDLWVGFQVTDDTGKKSGVCQKRFFDFGLITFTYTVSGAGAVNFTISRSGSAVVPVTWSFDDGSPDVTGNSMAHTFVTGGLHTITATVCAKDVTQVIAQNDRLVGTLDDIVDWETLINLGNITINGSPLLTGELPPEIGTLTSLSNISLNNNNLTGPLPVEWGNLSNLSILNLVVNNLTGPLPPEWAGMTAMTNFQTGYNPNLVGPLPPEWAAWTNMISLYIEQSPLIGGTLPPEYAAWTNLVYFWAGNIGVTGTLPVEYAAWTNLQYFLVNANSLTGILHPEYAAWTGLTRFDVSGNDFTGTLPPEYGAWTGLTYFGAQNNLLTGSLPPEYGAWGAGFLRFYMASNQLTGTLPTEYSAWVDVIAIQLHGGNVFSGPIPATWSSLVDMAEFLIGTAGSSLDYASPGAMAGWSSMGFLYLIYAGLDSAEIEGVLADIVSAGAPNNGYTALYQSPSAPLTAAACTSRATLLSLGWTVIYDAGGAC